MKGLQTTHLQMRHHRPRTRVDWPFFVKLTLQSSENRRGISAASSWTFTGSGMSILCFLWRIYMLISIQKCHKTFAHTGLVPSSISIEGGVTGCCVSSTSLSLSSSETGFFFCFFREGGVLSSSLSERSSLVPSLSPWCRRLRLDAVFLVVVVFWFFVVEFFLVVALDLGLGLGIETCKNKSRVGVASAEVNFYFGSHSQLNWTGAWAHRFTPVFCRCK